MRASLVVSAAIAIGPSTAEAQRSLPGDITWTGPSTTVCSLVANRLEWTDSSRPPHTIAIDRRLGRSVVGAFCDATTAYVLTGTAFYGFPLVSADGCEDDICISGGVMQVDLRRELSAGVIAWAHSETHVYVLRKDRTIYSFPIVGSGAATVIDASNTLSDEATRMAYVDGCLLLLGRAGLASFDLRNGKTDRGASRLFGRPGLREPSFRRHRSVLYFGELGAERDVIAIGPACIGDQ